MESAAMSFMTKKNELQIATREKGKDHLQVKLLQEEIDETNTQMRELKTQLDNNQTKMISLQKRRDQFPSEWK